jgi:hypothetical protein
MLEKRGGTMRARLRSGWQKIRSGFRSGRKKITHHPFITIGIIVVLFVLIAFTFAVNKYGWDWTGFGKGVSKTTTTMITPGTTVATETQPPKKLWDWLGLLAVLAIPVVVGFGAAWFTVQQAKVSDKENTDKLRETALQGYIDKMSELLLDRDNPLRESKPEDEVRKIARVRTLTILPRLDDVRKGSVLQFLYESSLMDKDKCLIDLSGANLSRATLHYANLSNANLHGADLIEANLNQANLGGAILTGARPHGANLREADLRGANLSRATLYGADLSNAQLNNANLSDTYLNKANLISANLTEVNLIRANLSRTIGCPVPGLLNTKTG